MRDYKAEIESLRAELARARLDGWVAFGTHAPYPDVPLEFSAELDEGGLPLWERVREP